VMEDLQQIDEVQKDLRRELQNAPKSSREEIIQTMIKNYQTKLDILERVLTRVQVGNNLSNDSITIKKLKDDSI
jgi:hypothetical protein